MGMDGVELVMAVEEEFGIAIDDRDAERIVTVGQLWDYICERMTFTPAASCATAAAFYRLRRAFLSTTAIARNEFRPHVTLAEWLPSKNRSVVWSELEKACGLTLPSLEFSALLEKALFVVTLTLSVLTMAGMRMLNLHWSLIAIAFIPLLLVFDRIADRAASRCRIQLNPAWATAGGLARTVVGLNPNEWNLPATQSCEIAWERLRAIIAETLGVSADLVRPEASFVNDLGMD